MDEVIFYSNNSTDQAFQISRFREWDYVVCSSLNDSKVAKYVHDINSQEGFDELVLCPDFKGQGKDFVVYDNNENYTYKWVSIRLYPCSLEDPTKCASAQEINHLASSYGYPYKLLEPSDFKNPMRSSPTRRTTYFDTRSTSCSNSRSL